MFFDARQNLFELLFALSILPFLGLQQTGQFLLLLAQHVLLELLLLGQDRLCLKRKELINLFFYLLDLFSACDHVIRLTQAHLLLHDNLVLLG